MEKDLFMDKHDKYYGLSTRNRAFMDKQYKKRWIIHQNAGFRGQK